MSSQINSNLKLYKPTALFAKIRTFFIIHSPV
jgi:hypothetical protein